MKIVIDISEGIMEYVKNNGCLSVIYTDEVAKAIINGTPYEERQISHEQECIIEELENICINNEYVLELLAKLKNGEES